MSQPTTRQLRHHPLTVVHTGNGKGKTTAAFGLALRGWAQGWSIAVFQFSKSGKWRTGEQRALSVLSQSGEGGAVTWEQLGQGWSWTRANATVAAQQAAAEAARQGWQRIRELLEQQAHDLYLLDEFTYPVAHGWIEADEVAQVLRSRPGHQHVVITGRRCPEPLLAVADLATEMVKLAHPFDAGHRGQAGIEW